MPTAAMLVLRVAFAGLFLYTSRTLVGDNWEWTVTHTAIVFETAPSLFAAAGVAVMIGGGLSVLLGFLGRVGAALLVLFLLPGALIHFREMDIALRMGQEIGATATALEADAMELAFSAYGAHLSSALKNLSLAGIGLALAITGTGPFSLLREEALTRHLRRGADAGRRDAADAS